MASDDIVVQDIFEGAEKVEILGKLPFILREYINHGQKFVNNIGKASFDLKDSVDNMDKIIDVLGKAADILGNPELKERISGHAQMLAALSKGEITEKVFKDSFTSSLTDLEGLAGGPQKMAGDGALAKGILAKELDKADKVKMGRSADVVVSVELINKIKDFLEKETITEGISSVLVIDNAGSLIANVGEKLDLDVISLAAVAAANFAATERIARLIGEPEFVLLFYKGRSESFHFCRVGRDYIIVTIFNNSLSLGLVRLKIGEVAMELQKLLPKREG